jgi:hypothetical protein
MAHVLPDFVAREMAAVANARLSSLPCRRKVVVFPVTGPMNASASPALKLNREKRLSAHYLRLSRICVATSNASAYYDLVSRLRKGGLGFESLVPGSDHRGCELVLTTRDEAAAFGGRAMVLEELDEDPEVFKGQIVSRLEEEERIVYVGVDPGVRTGLAVYYGHTPIAFGTFDAPEPLCAKVAAFARRLHHRRFILRIGDGNPRMAESFAEALGRAIPGATIEIVDEKGTSGRTPGMKGLQGDQRAASKIAFRKGGVMSSGKPRTRG